MFYKINTTQTILKLFIIVCYCKILLLLHRYGLKYFMYWCHHQKYYLELENNNYCCIT